ncbi:hypothetical protein PybrP1_007738 [[Pythium] brassicae (nom. inval.)]|nr:hypothetical protein PybrP1_007738 [[Pythium] brassicae (nom. inval.)]
MTRNSEAIRLAEASDWEGLLRLIELAPELAAERGDYGMLPVHWACTEAHVPAALLDRLLAAHPGGARTKNAVHLLPLHIAIRASMPPHLLRRLLAANPLAARVPTPDGRSTIALAKQVNGFSDEAMKLLLDAFNESATPEQDSDDDGSAKQGADNDDDDNNNTVGKSPVAADERADSLFRGPRHGYQLVSSIARAQELPGAPTSCDLLGSHAESELDAFLDDEQEWWTQAGAAGSPLARSLSLLSDDGTVDSPHGGHLISPSSSSASSRARSSSSANSAPLPIAPPLHKQMAGPFQRKHSLDYHHAVAAAAARQSQEALLARRSRTQLQARPAPAQLGGRHQSLPVIPTFEDFRLPAHARHPQLQHQYELQHQLRDVYHDRSSSEDDGDDDRADNGADGSRHRRVQRFMGSREFEFGVGAGDRRSRPRFESPPEWKRDDECGICHASFSVFKHRHHCRNCGKSICSQHSADRKLAMAAKGFKAPQRVCVTCYAALTTRTPSLRSASEFDAVLDAAGLGGPNPVAAFALQQQQLLHPHYAVAGAQALRSPQFASPVGGGGHSPTGTYASSRGSQQQPTGRDLALQSHVSDLRRLVKTQQQQLEALAQSNMQLQQQVLEQEELKAETMLLITQLMTRVSVLELQKHTRQLDDDDDDDDDDHHSDRSGVA